MATLNSEMELQPSVGNLMNITAGPAPPKSCRPSLKVAGLAVNVWLYSHVYAFSYHHKLKNTINYFYYNYHRIIIA